VDRSCSNWLGQSEAIAPIERNELFSNGRSTCLSTAGVEAKRRFLEIADKELRDWPRIPIEGRAPGTERGMGKLN
jgi:hypothetical protein